MQNDTESMMTDGDGAVLSISARRVAWVLTVTGGFLFAAHTFMLVMKHGFGRDYVFGLADVFNVNYEMNVPTLASTLLLISCAAMLGFTAAIDRGSRWDRWSWATLALVFTFLGFDEFMAIHETLTGPVRDMVQSEWIPAFAWVLPYGVGVVLLGLIMMPWFLRLDRPTQIRFVIAGCIFVGGALGIELIESRNFSAMDSTLSAEGLDDVNDTLYHAVITLVQESMEYIGAGYFLWTLINRLGGIRLSANKPA